MLGIARIAENGLAAAAAITAAIAFLGVFIFDVSAMLGMLITPVTTMLSAAVLAFVLLRHQQQAAMITALAAGGIMLFAGLIMQQSSVEVLGFIGICWLGALVVASVLRHTVSLRLAVLATIPVMLVVGIVGSMLEAHIVHYFEVMSRQSLANFTEAELAQINPDNLELMRSDLPRMLAESVSSWALFVVLCSVFISRYWQAQLFNPGGFQKEFHSLRLGKEAVIAFAVVIALSMVFKVPLFAIVASALIFVFFIQGLSVVHCLTRQRGLSRGWLIGMYFILALPPTMLLLSLLGMADNYFPIRKI